VRLGAYDDSDGGMASPEKQNSEDCTGADKRKAYAPTPEAMLLA
jgi:hypothetical protein